MTAHTKRLVSGFAPIPIVIWIIFTGGIVFSLFLSTLTLIALWEYYRIVFNLTQRSCFGPIPMVGYAITLLLMAAAHVHSFQMMAGFLVLNLILAAAIALIRFQKDQKILEEIAKQILGIVYIGFLFAFLMLIRHSQDGVAWIFFLLFLVFIGDVGAYYAGTYLGRHKLLPSVSPGKTIEGSLGGLAASIVVGVIFKLFFLPDISMGLCFLFFICVGVIAPMGDLFESVLKRVGNIKDSGKIMPGHGGILDRVDALLFAAPVAYLFKEYIL